MSSLVVVEPTSGLVATSALKLLDLLHDLAGGALESSVLFITCVVLWDAFSRCG